MTRKNTPTPSSTFLRGILLDLVWQALSLMCELSLQKSLPHERSNQQLWERMWSEALACSLVCLVWIWEYLAPSRCKLAGAKETAQLGQRGCGGNDLGLTVCRCGRPIAQQVRIP